MIGTKRLILNELKSATNPVKGGIIAPPTIPQHKMPEPSAALSLKCLDAREKMVGNIIELKKPTDKIAMPEIFPLKELLVNKRAITARENIASNLAGVMIFINAEQRKRATIAPPQ